MLLNSVQLQSPKRCCILKGATHHLEIRQIHLNRPENEQVNVTVEQDLTNLSIYINPVMGRIRGRTRGRKNKRENKRENKRKKRERDKVGETERERESKTERESAVKVCVLVILNNFTWLNIVKSVFV